MGIGVPEIRERAERLKSDIARERYEWKAGIKPRPDFVQVYEAHDLLARDDVLPAIQRELAEAKGADVERLRSLFSWVAVQRIEARLAPMEDQYRAWESATHVTRGETQIPIRAVTFAIENQPRREVREALESQRSAWMEEAIPLQVDTLHREREAVAELGLGSYVEGWERLTRLNVRAVQRDAMRILAGTEDVYREHLAYQLGRLGVDPGEATRGDARFMRRMGWADEYFQLDPVLDVVRKDLDELGLPLTSDGGVRLDVEHRSGKLVRSFCAPLQVPGEVVLVVAPSGGWPDCTALLHEVGHALHFAHTRDNLPFEYRSLGDPSVTETYAVLFELLVLERGWLERTVGLAGKDLEDYLAHAGLVTLVHLRLLAARLIYQLELHASDRPGQMHDRFDEIMAGATGFRFDPRTFLLDLARGFWVARQLRAWMLRALLHGVLLERYDVDWYRNPAAGPFLGELLSSGQRDDAAQLAAQLGAEKLGAGPLIDSATRWLA